MESDGAAPLTIDTVLTGGIPDDLSESDGERFPFFLLICSNETFVRRLLEL